MRPPSFNTVLLLLVCGTLLGAQQTHAQERLDEPAQHRHVLMAEDYDAHTRVLPALRAGKTANATSANIEVTYNGFSPEARAAFQYAVDVWEQHISSPVTIRIQATWQELDENVLGSAGPRSFYGNFPNAPEQNTWYPLALAHALNGARFSGAPAFDIDASFSSAMSWYYGTDGRPPAGTFDLVTVVMHEIGHGLGFFQSFQVDDDESERDECPGAPEGHGCWGLRPDGGSTPFPIIFDRFVQDIDGVSLLNQARYPNPSEALGTVLQSGAVRFSGPSAISAYENVPIDLYSPASFEPASSIAHLDEETFMYGDPNSLMTPRLARAEAIHSPGGIFCGILEDIGWTLGDGCFALIQAEIIAFDATRAAGTAQRVELNWTTGPEAELTEFVVEQQYFDDAFEQVARIDVDPDQRNYSLTLEDLAPGRYTFRVRFVRADGTTASGPPAEVIIPLSDQVAIEGPFPNPFRTSTTVDVLVRRTQDIDAFLYDSMGRLVETVVRGRRVMASDRLRLGIDAGSLSSGVYYLQVIGSEFNTTTSLVLVR